MPDSEIIADLQAQLKQKDQFLATISHEIRSPMNGVFGMADALLRTDLDAVQKRYLTVLMDACESMLSIANQVLDISKTSSGQACLAPVDFDLADFMTKQIAGFSKRAEARNIALDLKIKFEADPRIHLDKFRLGQIVTNLVSNALRYTDAGWVTVDASLKPVKKNQLELTLLVSDSGIGMSADAISQIFDAFGSANPVESAARGGTGLGLTVVRDLVEMMQGDIQVESTFGQGSAFCVKLLVEPSKTTWHMPRPMQKSIPDNLKILHAEDNDSNAFVFDVMLEQSVVNITRVSNGADAVKHASDQVFDMIFMDIQMPVMNGIDATRQIRANEALAQLGAVPIVALSADVFASRSENFQTAGFTDSLPKPIRQNELLDMLATFDKGIVFD